MPLGLVGQLQSDPQRLAGLDAFGRMGQQLGPRALGRDHAFERLRFNPQSECTAEDQEDGTGQSRDGQGRTLGNGFNVCDHGFLSGAGRQRQSFPSHSLRVGRFELPIDQGFELFIAKILQRLSVDEKSWRAGDIQDLGIGHVLFDVRKHLS